jgi:crossover junction endodeoxyribonuclease RusA
VTDLFLFEVETAASRSPRKAAGRRGEVAATAGSAANKSTPTRRKRRPKPQVTETQPILHVKPYTERRFKDEIADVEDTCWRPMSEVLDPYVIARFEIEGEPAVKSRPRFVRAGARVKTYTPKKTVDAENVVAWQFRQSRPDWTVDSKAGFGVFGVFYAETNQRRDVDNMLKLVLDALNGVVWLDDAQVVEVIGRVGRGGHNGPARTAIMIYRIPIPPAPTRRCEKCGTEFRIYKSTSKQRFCSRNCNKVLAAARMTRSAHKDNTRACTRCGSSFTVTGSQWYKKRYCSEACQHEGATTDLTCIQCGKAFAQWTSWKPAGAALCSKECGVAYWRSNGTKQAKGACQTCGGPVSRREYRNCRACVRATTPPRTRGPKPKAGAR